jgi:hypothetical protein
VGLTNEQGFSFLSRITTWWQGAEKQIAGDITKSLVYDVSKEQGNQRGLITFITKEKKIVAYVGYEGKKLLTIHGYMVPEKI